MNLKTKIILLMILVVLGIFFPLLINNYTNKQNQSNKEPKMINISFQTLEIMRTNEEKSQGLMNRMEFCYNCGMLFVWDSPQVLNFWMKNTFVNIDIIYIDQDNIVKTLIKNPPTNNDTISHSSIVPVVKVLEIPTKRSKDLNIKEGDTIKLDIK